jgi:stringent starvation protein B
MTSLKPYLIRSIYEWIIDNDFTPHLLVNAEHTDAVLPEEFIDEGRIVLNIRPQAVFKLNMGNDEIDFNARFAGRSMHVIVPVKAVLAIYAKENGQGMVFDQEDTDDDPAPEPKKTRPTKPQLRVVK